MRAILLGLLMVLVLAAPAQAQDSLSEQLECSQFVPPVVSPPLNMEPIDVRLLVLLDGVTQARAEEVLAKAAVPFEPLALRLVPVGFVPVTLNAGRVVGDVVEASKMVLGGGRPAGVDLVVTLTWRTLVDGKDSEAVTGYADCIGGVSRADKAFAVGEAADNEWAGAEETLAHEIGHLLGAHHHYANCAESASPNGGLSQCTLMFLDLTVTAMKFGALEASVIRGQAETYLPGEPFPGAKVPAPPEPAPQAQPQPAPAPAPAPVAAAPAPAQASPEPRQPSAACRAAQRRLKAARRSLRSARGARRARHRAAVRRAQRAARRACG